ncbi:MAG: sigma-54-dependent Fis family transcriptional regulator, partial [Acidobacteria bacterium]|nr:sigma-54-dependent Fis family transcriptional regulator [Acidobacteriota bacterium]
MPASESLPEPLAVLVVEDQPAVAEALAVLFDVHGIPCEGASSPAQALERLSRPGIGAVVQDMNFDRGETSGAAGEGLFAEIRARDPRMPVLLMTAFTDLEAAVRLVKQGANDYFRKPWDDAKLVASVRNLLALRTLQLENESLRSQPARARSAFALRHDLCGLVYESEALHEAVMLAVQVAPSNVPVLVTGPNGAGKEKIAEIVQANSRRRDRPFVRVNVGALPDELLEAELFGAEAGAYTGATKRRFGRFEAADSGTLFLDEIGNLSAAGQMKLLRVLQSSEFERLGSSETRRVDVRVVCATNSDLPAAIKAGRFREDLYFRLNVIEIAVPPLRDRPDDVLPLSRSFLAEAAAEAGRALRFTREAEALLLSHAWPGNVREVSNRVKRAALVAKAEDVSGADLG